MVSHRLRGLAILAALLGVAALALALVTANASATVLCETAANPCPHYYGKGTIVNAGGPTVLHSPSGEVKCGAIIRAGKITNAGAKVVNVAGTVTKLEFEECKAIQVLKSGTFSVRSPSKGNGVLTIEGLELTVETGGLHCIWGGSGSIAFKGGERASMAGAIELTRVGGKSGAACGATAEWTVEMGFGPLSLWGPEQIYAEESPVPTVLCKTNTNPCSGGTYGKGTVIEMALKAQSVIHDPSVDITCNEASLKGETTDAGGEGKTVTGTISALSFGSCMNGPVSVLSKGVFAINAPSEGGGS